MPTHREGLCRLPILIIHKKTDSFKPICQSEKRGVPRRTLHLYAKEDYTDATKEQAIRSQLKERPRDVLCGVTGCCAVAVRDCRTCKRVVDAAESLHSNHQEQCPDDYREGSASKYTNIHLSSMKTAIQAKSLTRVFALVYWLMSDPLPVIR